MKKHVKALAVILCASIIASPVLPVKQDNAFAASAREVEYLGRGGYAIASNNGVYLSWRLLGSEPINQTFDIYRNDEKIVSDMDATNYTDANGKAKDVYKVTPHNGTAMENDVFIASARDYKDVILDKPAGGDGYTYEFNEVSVGDMDNDGEYEFIVKWDPTNRQDNSIAGYTGNVLIDCYKQDGTKLWRIDLGKNIRAGSHYTQFIVYDFDSDGKAEMALRTAPGSKDGQGNYVSAKGAAIDGEALTWKDAATGEVFTDESDLRSTAGGTLGKILKGPDWITMFNGETGEAMQTVNYYPQRGNVRTWGDDYANRSERYNAGVAYLDGVHPSLIMARGYYMRAAMAAYNWDGKNFSIVWKRDDNEGKMNKTLYGNGDHQISVCDADNDGKDEIVFGSTVVDDDGSILNSTDHGHGDALHASDFNNDGEQEIFQVHEDKIGFEKFGAEVRKAKDAAIIAAIPADDDVGRGLMGNFDDDYNDTSEFFSSADANTYDFNGNRIGDAPANINPSFLIWWDGDLTREILSRTSISKYDIKTGAKKSVRSFSQVHFGDKDAPALSADLLGDWREEICYPTEDNGTLRIFMTTTPTAYKMPTLLHDTQYRTAIAWQNVGYNQPPHPKFYVGKAALASNGKYLSPKTGFDTVTMVGPAPAIKYPTQSDISDGVYTLTVKAAGDLDKTLRTAEVKGGESFSYGFPKYIVEDGFAYEATANTTGAHYGGSIANVVRDEDIEITYTRKYRGVVFLEDLDNDTEKSADVRASNCLAMNNKPYTSKYKLKPGNEYTVIVRCQNSGRGAKFNADGKTILEITNNNGAWQDYTISGVTVDNESAITTLPGSNRSYDPLDTVLIINETAQKLDPTKFNMTSLQGTGLSVTGASSVTANTVVIAGVTGDGGSKSPSGYITYTAPEDGTLSLNFQSSATKDNRNKPRLYYCTDLSNATKNNATGFFEADGANSPLAVNLSVSKGTTYYLFGYLYSYSSAFNYTLTDFAFTPWSKTYPITFVDYDDTVLETREVAAGTMPTDSAVPERAMDDLYTYTFTGWSPSLTEASGAATYKAQYTRNDREYYDVNLILNGGTIANGKEVESYRRGTGTLLPTADDIVREGYSFDGWYENKEFTGNPVVTIASSARGTQTYYAKWTASAVQTEAPAVTEAPLQTEAPAATEAPIQTEQPVTTVSPTAAPSTEPQTAGVEPVDALSDKLTIETIEDEDDVLLVITPEAGENLGELTLYTAVYNADGTLHSVTPEICRTDTNGRYVIPLRKPQTENGEYYRLLLWNVRQSPIIKVISPDTEIFK